MGKIAKKVQPSRKPTGEKPPFKTIVKIAYNDLPLYRPVKKVNEESVCQVNHGKSSAVKRRPQQIFKAKDRLVIGTRVLNSASVRPKRQIILASQPKAEGPAPRSALKVRRVQEAEVLAESRSARTVRFAQRRSRSTGHTDVAPAEVHTPITVHHFLAEESQSPQPDRRNTRNAGSTPWNSNKIAPKPETEEQGETVLEQTEPSAVVTDKHEAEEAVASAAEPETTVGKSTRSSKKSVKKSEKDEETDPPVSRKSRRLSRKSIIPTDEEFKAMHDAELKNLQDMRDKWNFVREDVEAWDDDDQDDTDDSNPKGRMSKEDVLTRINSADWSAKIVMNKRFSQFMELFEKRTNNPDPDRPVLLSDLKGLWDLIQQPISNVYQEFRALEVLKENNWVEPERRRSRKAVISKSTQGIVKKKNATKNSKVSRAASGMRQHILAVRKQMEEAARSDTNADEELALVAESEHEKEIKPRKSRKKSARPSAPAMVVGLFEEVLDDIEPEQATTVGAHLEPESVRMDEDRENILHEINPSPDRIGIHPLTPSEKAFDALVQIDASTRSKRVLKAANAVDATPRTLRSKRN